jgi:hypothetical protein
MNGHRRKKTAPNLRRLRAGWGLLFLLYGALAVFLSAGPSLGATQADYALSVAVGPGRAISLRLPDGGKLGRMSAGSYTIYVTDRSRRDNFHLIGPAGLSKKTGVAFVGTRRWTVTLRKGTYRYRSDAHPAVLSGNFTVV